MKTSQEDETAQPIRKTHMGFTDTPDFFDLAQKTLAGLVAPLWRRFDREAHARHLERIADRL
jgi:hypothetical protein